MRTSTLLCACVLVLTGPSVYAQSRQEVNVGGGRVEVSTPGNSGSTSFKNYSYGSGNTMYGAPTTNVLGSSMSSGLGTSSPFMYTPKGLDSSSAPGVLGSQALPVIHTGEKVYKGMDTSADDSSGDGAIRTILKNRANLRMADVYSESVSPLVPGKGDKRVLVKSLVPTGGGLYHDFLDAGETAFRARDYTVASSKFQMANYIGHNDPESLLSMAHTQFAQNSYPLAAYYLRKTLKYMPKLPMVRLEPKGFYGDPSVYVQDIQQLDDYLSDNPGDSDAQLLRAYFSWFDTDDPNYAVVAKTALARALSSEKNPESIQAIEAFWDGMVASGKVKGDLKPLATASTSKPADEAKPADNPKKS